MSRRVLHGLCGAALAAAFLVGGIEAQKPVATAPTSLVDAQTAQLGRGMPAGGVTWDFETGNLVGWQASGRAFVFQPTLGDNPVARQRESANLQGKYWIGTFERYQGRGGPGGIQGDEPQGTLTSIPFTIPPSLTFRIGGGSTSQTRVELLVLDQIEGEIRVMTASGKNSETMFDTSWDLRQWAGRSGRLRIVDEASGPWGHINVDDFRFGRSPRAVDDFKVPRGERGLDQTPTAMVPDLSGLTEAQAREVLAKARLTVGKISTVGADIKPGTVYEQDRPPRSRVPLDTPVSFALAIPITTTVPDLSGLTEAQAREVLAKARLTVGKISTVGADIKPGTVYEQDRPPRSRVPLDTPVSFALAIPITTTVPDLSGLTEAQAREVLAKARLTVGKISTVGADIKPGTVYEQDRPPRSRVPLDTPVSFALAIPITTTVPDLSGLTEAQAREVLAKARLTVGKISTVGADIKPGTVYEQDRPPRSRVPLDTPVSFALAIPITTTVPDLSGLTEAQAREALAKARLTVGKISTVGADIKPGTVYEQDRPPRSRVPLDTPVSFALAIPITTTVPDLSGLTEAQAREALAKARLTVGKISTVGADIKPGTVYEQDRPPRSRVPLDTPVSFALAIPITTTVPDLSGLTEAQAREVLAKARLTVGKISTVGADIKPGTVYEQDRPPRSRVPLDTPVSFALAIPITTTVPDLSGLTEAQARDLLTKARLRAGDVGSNEDRRPQGTVISQNPAANTQVVIGTAVALVTAKPVMVVVPRVVDLSEERARQRLAEVELVAGTIEHRESAGTPGTVLAQSINPDERMPLGTLVNLVVSAIETVPVPPFVGVPIEQARRTLLENRLGVGEQPRATNVEAPGTVVAQGHLPGARVAVGTAIVLTVAVPVVVTVPPVVGLPHAAAAAAISAAGLEVGTIGLRLSLQAGGTVLMQATAPGAQVPFGTRVALDEARPRVVWLAPLAVLLLAAGGLVKARTGRKRPSEDRTPPLDFSVRPQVDAGDAHVESDATRPVDREVRIQPVTDGGYQDLSAAAGDLIRSERKEVL